MSLSEIEQRLVVPFYLPMMSTNAVDLEPGLHDELARVSTTVTVDEVHLLLGTAWGWRPLVMGAWFALAMSDGEPMFKRTGYPETTVLGSEDAAKAFMSRWEERY